jgi:hypothetical protein
MILRLHIFLYLIDEPIYALYVGLLAMGCCVAALRLSRRSFNRKFALIGGAFAVLGCLIFLLIRISEKWYWPLPDWQVYSFWAGVFCLSVGGIFLLGSLLIAVYGVGRSAISSSRH